MLHRVCAAVVAAIGLCALPGCAASHAAAPGPAVSASSSGAASSAAGRIVVDERDNHRVVTVARGSTVTVALHSTYWQFAALPSRRVLTQIAAPRVSPRPPHTGGCVPGQGCGTVTAVYRAAGTGTAVIRASRLSCGEAMRCTGGQGRFAVTVVVRP
ncbi:MAG TPA: hypothetical protein VKD26_13875 [Streptosporangiaceae bacterium]|nr:hypothetical protein [Streptosporangiaceae bacterium]